MNEKEFQSALEKVQVTWNCIHRREQHEVGCPHKEWSSKELLDALIAKKKFEQSGLRGTQISA